MKINKFWNCLKAIANLFDFTVILTFEDGVVKDFKIMKEENVESEVNFYGKALPGEET